MPIFAVKGRQVNTRYTMRIELTKICLFCDSYHHTRHKYENAPCVKLPFLAPNGVMSVMCSPSETQILEWKRRSVSSPFHHWFCIYFLSCLAHLVGIPCTNDATICLFFITSQKYFFLLFIDVRDKGVIRQ